MKVSSALAVAALFLAGGVAGTNAGPLAQATATDGATVGVTVGATVDVTSGATTEGSATLPATVDVTGTTVATGTVGATTAATSTVVPTTAGNTGGAAATSTTAPTATRGAGAAATAAEQSATAKCVPVEVTVFTRSPRLHVKCEAPTDGILYFATGTENADNAQRVLMVITTALTNGKALSIVYNPADTTGQAIGCLSKDCRLIISVSILR